MALTQRRGWGATVKKTLNRQDGFTLVELLIVVAIIGIIASIGVAQILRARLVANETAAIGSMRSVNSGQMSYSAAAGQGGFSTSLTILGATCPGSITGFISPDLNPTTPGVVLSGTGLLKTGYAVDMTGNGVAGPVDCNGNPTNNDYAAFATPRTFGATGERGFNTSGAGTIFFDPAGGAAGTTPIQ